MSLGLPRGTGHGKVREVTVSDVSRNIQEASVAEEWIVPGTAIDDMVIEV